MKSLRIFAIAGALALATSALRADTRSFTPGEFEAAQKAGKSILIEVHANWCPTCKAQEPILSKLQQDPRFKEIAVYRIDFDSQKDAVRRFGARMQSTLIVFKGSSQAGRSVGDTYPKSIEALLKKAL